MVAEWPVTMRINGLYDMLNVLRASRQSVSIYIIEWDIHATQGVTFENVDAGFCFVHSMILFFL